MTKAKAKYDPVNMPAIASIVMRRGAHEADLAYGLEIPKHKVQYWKRRHPEFNRALAIGRLVAWAAGLRPDLESELTSSDQAALRRAAIEKIRRGEPSDEELEILEQELLAWWHRFCYLQEPVGCPYTSTFLLRQSGFAPMYRLPNGKAPKFADVLDS